MMMQKRKNRRRRKAHSSLIQADKGHDCNVKASPDRHSAM